MSLLRFVGMSAENATHLAHKLRRSPLVAPAFGTAHNPIEPELQRELDDYFRPFQVPTIASTYPVCVAAACVRSCPCIDPR